MLSRKLEFSASNQVVSTGIAVLLAVQFVSNMGNAVAGFSSGKSKENGRREGA